MDSMQEVVNTNISEARERTMVDWWSKDTLSEQLIEGHIEEGAKTVDKVRDFL